MLRKKNVLVLGIIGSTVVALIGFAAFRKATVDDFGPKEISQSVSNFCTISRTAKSTSKVWHSLGSFYDSVSAQSKSELKNFKEPTPKYSKLNGQLSSCISISLNRLTRKPSSTSSIRVPTTSTSTTTIAASGIAAVQLAVEDFCASSRDGKSASNVKQLLTKVYDLIAAQSISELENFKKPIRKYRILNDRLSACATASLYRLESTTTAHSANTNPVSKTRPSVNTISTIPTVSGSPAAQHAAGRTCSQQWRSAHSETMSGGANDIELRGTVYACRSATEWASESVRAGEFDSQGSLMQNTFAAACQLESAAPICS